MATLIIVFKVGMEALKDWRRLNVSVLLEKVISGAQFIDGATQQQVA